MNALIKGFTSPQDAAAAVGRYDGLPQSVCQLLPDPLDKYTSIINYLLGFLSKTSCVNFAWFGPE